jgi:hypothetical protein
LFAFLLENRKSEIAARRINPDLEETWGRTTATRSVELKKLAAMLRGKGLK